MDDIYDHMVAEPGGAEATETRTLAMHVSPAFTLAYLRNSSDPTMLLSTDGRITFLNDPMCRIFALDGLDAAKGRFWWELWPDDMEQALGHALARVRDGEPVRFSAVLDAEPEDGRWSVLVSPVTNREGAVETIFVAMFEAD